MKNLNLLLAAAIGLMAIGCANNNGKSGFGGNNNFEPDFANDLNKAKQVFYSLPSPIETAYLIRSTGVPYSMDLANPTDNATYYSTTMQKALNFGVYGADLSYASLFNQTQETIQYMATEKKIADDLGIFDFAQSDIIERIESNINDRDSLMEIITDGFNNANGYLKDVGQAEVAALIVAGGWIEGLYLATSLAQTATDNNARLIDLVIDQRHSLSILIKLLESYKDMDNVSKVYGWLNDLQASFDRIKTTSSDIKTETTTDGKTTLAADTDVLMNDKLFAAICQKTDSIRTIIVK